MQTACRAPAAHSSRAARASCDGTTTRATTQRRDNTVGGKWVRLQRAVDLL
eukprot:CAMPEP_0171097328 /NCGR_PEP_ID=MMETSP0766_2-20121228/47482_1 /TAXON_ID=439317 /ORGANISM="Gambierdiscus australes, Strain CAWD 149" /LENGTH=50 /DNA_ID=CAMNT_0011556509 /DNA_START=85 /DNA_END=237 /DNA_ORIENTATION=-